MDNSLAEVGRRRKKEKEEEEQKEEYVTGGIKMVE